MTDRRRLYNLRASSSEGKLVRSVSDEYDDEEFLIGSGRSEKPTPVNYLRIGVITVTLIAVFVSGYFCHVLVGGFFRTPSPVQNIVGDVRGVINPDMIREYHVELTKGQHMAGSAENYHLAEYIAGKFRAFSFDDVEMKNYSVELPYPDPEKPNSVKLFDSNGKVVHSCASTEKPLTDFEKENPVPPLFNAHSKPGSIKATYVYVNSASKEDFRVLAEHNVSVSGKIVLARYDASFRGNKVSNAAAAGAIGIVLFKDLLSPEQHTRFPDSELAPASASQRGSVLVESGDTATPGWPSVVDNIYKQPHVTAPIVSQPITGEDAVVLLRALPKNDNMELPKDWKVGLLEEEGEENYGVGADDGPMLEVTVNVEIKRVNITNVIGTITGSAEPDRWVFLGNHRDAWTYGAIDPSSGTAAMLEVGRSLSHFLSGGWRPRRTVKLCSWDAEEWGLIGSIEWLEENRAVLENRGVVYLNTDVAEGGKCGGVVASGSPLYHDLVEDVLSGVNNNVTGGLYDGLPGAGSDMFGFYCYTGIGVIDVECYTDKVDVYHTAYDEQHLFDIIDRDYRSLANVTTVLAQLVLSFSDPILIPGNMSVYSDHIEKWWGEIKPSIKTVIIAHGLDDVTAIIDRAIAELVTAAKEFQEATLNSLSKTSTELELRRANDVMMSFDRAFLVEEPIPGTAYHSRNLLVSPAIENSYDGSGFPGLQYVISHPDTVNRETVLRELERVRWALQAASRVLKS